MNMNKFKQYINNLKDSFNSTGNYFKHPQYFSINLKNKPKINTKVVFRDYDGTLLHTYTKDDFLSLTELPELPSQQSLVCQGWNWALEDAKAYVQEYGRLDIGATYITDNKTRLYINLLNDKISVPLYINQSDDNGVIVDWGDESDPETVSGTGDVIFNHTYNEAGSHIISLKVEAGTCALDHNSYSYNVMGSANTIPSGSLYKVEIGSNTSIGNYAFSSCYSLQSITIPNSVTSIGDSAFYNCSSLQSITIPNSVTSIGDSAFYNCSSLQSITIPNSVTSISNYSFQGCSSLQSVTIPNSVTSIGMGAFNHCTSLTSITIPNSVTSIGMGAFSYCSSLQSITIPNSVTSIGEMAFQGCTSLTSITIPNSVTSIGEMAFHGCTSLTFITIPNSVTSIGEMAFQGCTSLTSITIPNSVTSIGDAAFNDCYSMQYYDFTQCTSIPTLSNTDAFSGIKDGCEIRVPAELYGNWVNATNWSGYKDYIVPIGSNIKCFIFNAGGQYKKQYFEDGMTWGQWLNSPYNKSNKIISDIITPITESDLIIEKSVYDLLYGVYVVDLEGDLLDSNTFTGTADEVTGIGLITDNGRWIVALDGWYSSYTSTAWNGNQRSAWGGYNKTVTGCFLNSDKSKALLDFDGEANTDEIINQLKGTKDSYSSYYTGAPAAEYCRAYSKGYKDVGSWYLPAAGELNEIALNKDAINAILTKLGKNNLSKNSTTWSSSQYTASGAWGYNWSGSNWYNYYKNGSVGVHPVCTF